MTKHENIFPRKQSTRETYEEINILCEICLQQQMIYSVCPAFESENKRAFGERLTIECIKRRRGRTKGRNDDDGAQITRCLATTAILQ